MFELNQSLITYVIQGCVTGIRIANGRMERKKVGRKGEKIDYSVPEISSKHYGHRRYDDSWMSDADRGNGKQKAEWQRIDQFNSNSNATEEKNCACIDNRQMAKKIGCENKHTAQPTHPCMGTKRESRAEKKIPCVELEFQRRLLLLLTLISMRKSYSMAAWRKHSFDLWHRA